MIGYILFIYECYNIKKLHKTWQKEDFMVL